MLTELCAELHNYFEKDKYFGKFKIQGGSIAPLDFLKNGQYFRIIDSTLNDGIHQYPAQGLTDEEFDGAIWALAIPPAVVSLADEITAYTASDANKPSAFTSESFGGYSYTRATDANGAPLSWQKAYSSRLNKWRKI